MRWCIKSEKMWVFRSANKFHLWSLDKMTIVAKAATYSHTIRKWKIFLLKNKETLHILVLKTTANNSSRLYRCLDDSIISVWFFHVKFSGWSDNANAILDSFKINWAYRALKPATYSLLKRAQESAMRMA